MTATERLHALDAVRAYALILGIFLHATMPFLAGLPEGFWVWVDEPSTPLGAVFYLIHIFRMPAFYVIAGLFARMVVERRGVGAFVKDRAKRIGIPLVLGLPLILASIVFAALGAAAIAGVETTLVIEPTPEQQAAIPPGYFPWAHLWFLYYLLMFYVLALLLRAIVHRLDRGQRLRRGLDRIVRFAFSSPLGAIVPALPIGLWYFSDPNWVTWAGLPAPYLIWPEVHALIAYGIPFALGWLLHRQLDLLPLLGRRWRVMLASGIVFALGAYIMAGPTPVFEGSHVFGIERAVYTAVYMIATWCCILALISIAVRFWSDESPVRRYIADSSYWLYLLHMTVLAFFQILIGSLDWHWSLKYVVTLGLTIPVLLLSYHYLVRATFLGALLNGRRRPREELFTLLAVR